MKYALIMVAIEMSKQQGSPYIEKHAFIRYTNISMDECFIFIDAVLNTNTLSNITDSLTGSRWWIKRADKLYEFKDDEEAILWYKLNY